MRPLTEAGLGNMAFGTIAVAIFLGAMGMFAGAAVLYLIRQPHRLRNRPASARKK
jgi:hypothetical protein